MVQLTLYVSPESMGSKAHADRSIPVSQIDYDCENMFPSLPPLLHGPREVHFRDGITRASRLAASHDVDFDAENAFFVADLSQVYKQHLRWKKYLPDIKPFYAIKCHPDPYVLRLLAALGTGFDCASNNEVSQVMSIGGIDPSRIIYANPCKANSSIRHARRLGVDKMTFDNADELDKIASLHPGAKLVIRMLVDDSKSLWALGDKFGASLPSIPGLLSKAKALDLDVIGVSFHVGWNCLDPSAYTSAIRNARAVFDMGKEAGYTFGLLDIGGGFVDASFEDAASAIITAIDQYFPDRQGIEVIGEPGTYYVSNAFSLAANIIARRAPLLKGDEDTENPSPIMYYISDGVYGAFDCVRYGRDVKPYVLSMNGCFHVSTLEPHFTSSVWGPTCDSIDCVSPNVELPALKVGDWLGFDDLGAYSLSIACGFNGFEPSKVVYTSGGLEGVEVRSALAKFAAARNDFTSIG